MDNNNIVEEASEKSIFDRFKIGSDLKSIGKLILKTIRKPIKFLGGLLELNLFFLILTILISGIATFVNAKLFTSILISTGALETLNSLKLPASFNPYLNITTLSLITAATLEGFIAIFEIVRSKSASLIFTLLSIGVMAYSFWQNTNAGYGRLVIGIILVIATSILADKTLKKKVVKWEELSLKTRFGLWLKFKFFKLANSSKEPVDILRLNFQHLKNVYGIRQDSLKKQLIRLDMFDTRFFKQLPADRKKKKKD